MSKKLHNPKAYAPAVYIPCWLIQVPSNLLSHQAKLLYGRLAQWANESGKVFRSVPQLSEELGCSKSTIDRTIKELKHTGLIGTFHPSKGGVNHFEFYDHEWMYQPIKEQLSYKSNKSDVTSDLTLPHVKCDVTPTSDVTFINIKEIKRNKINNISTSNEVPLQPENFAVSLDVEKSETLDYGKFDGGVKSYFKNNHDKTKGEATQVADKEIEKLKSDYCEKRIQKRSTRAKSQNYDLEYILSNNIFQIPEQMISDWLINRKQKRAAVTQTVWNKLVKELRKCEEQGINPIEAFETMVTHGWNAIKPEWIINATNKKHHISNNDMNYTLGDRSEFGF